MKQCNKKKPEVLAIIPARGGSKGIPRKNIKNLCGKPLIAYSIEVALKSKWIDRVIVSTEDEEIAEISRNFGAEVPFLRPKEMAKDNSDVNDAILFTIRRLRADGCHPDISVTLYPTSPFRNPKLMNYLLGKMLNGHGVVYTVKLINPDRFIYFAKNMEDRYIPQYISGRIENKYIPKIFYRYYGLFFGSNYFGSENPYVHIIDSPASIIDIDYPLDFLIAEEVIKQGLFDFGLN